MLDKTVAAVKKLISDFKGIDARVQRLEKVKPVARDGRDGKDGVSPDPEALVTDVLAKIPAPKDGRDGRDGKDGKDGETPSVTDVAAVVLSKIPTPKDGKDGVSPDPKAIAKEVSAQVPTPRNGRDGKDGRKGDKGDRGAKGEPGRDGKSITDVKVQNNDLIVSIDGKPRNAGPIRLPAPESFTPGMGGAGGRHRRKVYLEEIGTFSTTTTQSPTGLGDAGKIRISMGAGGSTANGEFTIAPDGLITCIKNGIQYSFNLTVRMERSGSVGVSEIMGRFMYAVDGVEANAVQVLDSFAVRIDDADTIWREQFEIRFSPVVGSVLWFEVARNPGSNNSGQIGTTQPAGDLSGWTPSNSVSLTIGKLVTD